MPENNYTRVFNDILFLLYLAFFVSLVFAFRAISSMSIGLILVVGLIKNGIEQKKITNRNILNPLLIFCGLLFLMQFLSLLYTNDMEPVSYTHLRAHETPEHLVCRLLLEK